MAISLGLDAEQLIVRLDPDCDFVSALVATSDWAVGTSITLLLGTPAVEWDAIITGARADWSVPAATVAAWLASTTDRDVRLRYTTPDAELIWARGRVVST